MVPKEMSEVLTVELETTGLDKSDKIRKGIGNKVSQRFCNSLEKSLLTSLIHGDRFIFRNSVHHQWYPKSYETIFYKGSGFAVGRVCTNQ